MSYHQNIASINASIENKAVCLTLLVSAELPDVGVADSGAAAEAFAAVPRPDASAAAAASLAPGLLHDPADMLRKMARCKSELIIPSMRCMTDLPAGMSTAVMVMSELLRLALGITQEEVPSLHTQATHTSGHQHELACL